MSILASGDNAKRQGQAGGGPCGGLNAHSGSVSIASMEGPTVKMGDVAYATRWRMNIQPPRCATQGLTYYGCSVGALTDSREPSLALAVRSTCKEWRGKGAHRSLTRIQWCRLNKYDCYPLVKD